MTVGKLVSITMDCADPKGLATFWAAMLDGTIAMDSDDWVAVQTADGMYVSAYKVPDYTPPSWPDEASPKQFHLDVGVGAPGDLDAAEQAAIGLGATKAGHQPQPDKWRVLLDPAGHAFCLMNTPG